MVSLSQFVQTSSFKTFCRFVPGQAEKLAVGGLSHHAFLIGDAMTCDVNVLRSHCDQEESWELERRPGWKCVAKDRQVDLRLELSFARGLRRGMEVCEHFPEFKTR